MVHSSTAPGRQKEDLMSPGPAVVSSRPARATQSENKQVFLGLGEVWHCGNPDDEKLRQEWSEAIQDIAQPQTLYPFYCSFLIFPFENPFV